MLGTNMIERWLKHQKRIERVKCFTELQTAVKILNENKLESSLPVYKELTVTELLDQVYE